MEEMFLEIRNIAVEAATIIATPNWASKWSIAISFLAIIISGFVAWRQNKIAKTQTEIAERQVDISEQQNKIALFKERYAIYCEIQKILSFGEQVKGGKKFEKHIILRTLQILYEVELCNKIQADQVVNMAFQMEISESIIYQSLFLFSDICYDDISCFINKWKSFIMYIIVHDDSDIIDLDKEMAKIFINECQTFSSKYIDMIENQLNLK